LAIALHPALHVQDLATFELTSAIKPNCQGIGTRRTTNFSRHYSLWHWTPLNRALRRSEWAQNSGETYGATTISF